MLGYWPLLWMPWLLPWMAPLSVDWQRMHAREMSRKGNDDGYGADR